MGGDKQDLDLIRKRGKGKAKASRDDDEAEEDVSGVLFMQAGRRRTQAETFSFGRRTSAMIFCLS